MCDDELSLLEIIDDLKAFGVEITYTYDDEIKCVGLSGWHHGPFWSYREACLYLTGLYNGVAMSFATKAPFSASES